MNEKFFSLEQEKQRCIINAGFHAFSKYGYRHASTDLIAKEAGISKALLFHYFGNKKSFYLFLYDYAMNYLMDSLHEVHDYTETDFFKIVVNAQLEKMEIARQHPDLSVFIVQAYLEEDEEVQQEVGQDFQAAVKKSMESTLKRVDASKFKESITVEQAWNILNWLAEGYTKNLNPTTLENIDHATKEFLGYTELLRQHFYREEYL